MYLVTTFALTLLKACFGCRIAVEDKRPLFFSGKEECPLSALSTIKLTKSSDAGLSHDEMAMAVDEAHTARR